MKSYLALAFILFSQTVFAAASYNDVGCRDPRPITEAFLRVNQATALFSRPENSLAAKTNIILPTGYTLVAIGQKSGFFTVRYGEHELYLAASAVYCLIAKH